MDRNDFRKKSLEDWVYMIGLSLGALFIFGVIIKAMIKHLF
jgi:hypothetical protein